MENSPLGRLPPEIRVMIYKEILVETDALIIYNVGGRPSYFGYAYASRPFCDAIALRSVCRLMRQENEGLYISTNHIRIDALFDCQKEVQSGGPRVGENYLRDFCVEIADWGHWFGRSVLKPRSITLHLGFATDIWYLEWKEIRTAVCQFNPEVPVHLWIEAVPPNSISTEGRRDYFYGDFQFPGFTFQLSKRPDAIRTLDRLSVWYDEQRKHGRLKNAELLSPETVKEMLECTKRWIQHMPRSDETSATVSTSRMLSEQPHSLKTKALVPAGPLRDRSRVKGRSSNGYIQHVDPKAASTYEWRQLPDWYQVKDGQSCRRKRRRIEVSESHN